MARRLESWRVREALVRGLQSGQARLRLAAGA